MVENHSTRDIFLRVMDFKPSHRTIKWEFGYWGGAIKRWHREGLPEKGGFMDSLGYGDGLIGPGHPIGSPSWSGEIPELESEVQEYFGLDEEWALVPYDYWLFPKFEEVTFFEDDKYIEFQGPDGIRKRSFKDNSSMPMFLEYPVKNRKDWERIKRERLDINSIDKRYKNNNRGFIDWSKKRTKVLGLFDDPVGFFGSLRQLTGEKRLFMLYYDDPGLIREMTEHLCSLWISIAEKLVSTIEFDIAVFWEDMAGRQGSLISPSTFREFMMPQYKKLIGFLRGKGIRLFNIDCDGNINDLIPLFLEVGITSIYPFEQQAGNDLLQIREKYPELGIIGGIDKNILVKNRESIEKELQKVPYLIGKGGYIPYIDHMVPPNSPWENFKYYRERLNQIIDSIEVLG